jgi:hypothetical protein
MTFGRMRCKECRGKKEDTLKDRSSVPFILDMRLYEEISKIFRTGAAIHTAVATMSSESLYQVANSWVDVGSFHTRLFIFMICIPSVRNILDISSYRKHFLRINLWQVYT